MLETEQPIAINIVKSKFVFLKKIVLEPTSKSPAYCPLSPTSPIAFMIVPIKSSLPSLIANATAFYFGHFLTSCRLFPDDITRCHHVQAASNSYEK